MTSSQNPLSNALQCAKEFPLWGKLTIAAGVGLSIAAVVFYEWRKIRKRPTPYVKDFEPGMVYLFQFPRTCTVPNLSPFCLKMETWLRLADVPYKNVENLPRLIRSREGTLPFVELDGVEYPDSSLAITELTSLLGKQQMEDHMTPEQKAASRGMEALAEASLLPSSVYFRLPHAKKTFQMFQPGTIPGWLIPGLALWWKKFVSERLFAIGLAKHSVEDIRKIAETELRTLSTYLGAKHYFTGFKPTRVDATMFSVLALILYMPFDTPQKAFIEVECPNLREFCERVKKRYWPDWEECTAQYRMNSEWKSNVGRATKG